MPMMHDLSMCLAHVIPGLFMSSLALWWLANILKRVSADQQRSSDDGQLNGHTLTLPSYFLGPCCHFPLESLLKMSIGVGGIINEIYLQFAYSYLPTRLNDAQHLAILIMLGMVGVVELLRHFRFRGLPNGTERATFMVAVAIMAVSFIDHNNPAWPLRSSIHALLVYVGVALLICSCFELHSGGAAIFCLARAYLVLVLGTWFLQLGAYFAELGRWDEHNHEHHTRFVVFFVWHFVLNFLLILVMAVGIRVMGASWSVGTVPCKWIGDKRYSPVALK